MKALFITLFFVAILSGFTAGKNKMPEPKNRITAVKQDTVEFNSIRNFAGQCVDNCFIHLGTNTITKVNGRAVVNGDASEAYTLFCPCPSKIRLVKGKSYKYLVEHYNYKKYNDCIESADTLVNNHSYVLVKPLK